ncbi:hypothetical protein VCHA56P521_230037 [Vibrio chagasii]|nr:hypothetical protein VCHA34P120_100205 [Vibrio chagasii]CAH6808979.1 hypothetical protein VCHA36P161_110187 [Vibrio chagasii]CAH6827228.1 hypothetical protein VCHA32O87_150127 [Vibrio chagasii]CAH6882971.1 hypothetical protein VCHA34P126_240036 [Vibrio chagasii]CAH6899424.1 hypothetical protein VCHA43P277_110036 [Vibrio chagasii]
MLVKGGDKVCKRRNGQEQCFYDIHVSFIAGGRDISINSNLNAL